VSVLFNSHRVVELWAFDYELDGIPLKRGFRKHFSHKLSTNLSEQSQFTSCTFPSSFRGKKKKKEKEKKNVYDFKMTGDIPMVCLSETIAF
jgi:hypothetical protein